MSQVLTITSFRKKRK